MSYQVFPPALLTLSPLLTRVGDPGAAVAGVNTTTVADGALAYCEENKQTYRLDKQDDTTPADGTAVIAPLAGPGRWKILPGSPLGASATEVRANKQMAASATVSDGDLACATAVATTPATPTAAGGYVGVQVNGVNHLVGDGTAVAVECYFSGDGGVTPRALQDVVAGDLLYWNGSVAGFQLAAATDKVSFFYEVSS